MSHLVPLSHALAVGWTVELLAEMNLPIRGEFVDFTEYRSRVLSRWCESGELPTVPPIPGPEVRHVDAGPFPRSQGVNVSDATPAQVQAAVSEALERLTGQPRQASHWRDTAMKLSGDVVRERTYSARLAKRAVLYQLLALGGWVMFVAALVNRWAV